MHPGLGVGIDIVWLMIFRLCGSAFIGDKLYRGVGNEIAPELADFGLPV